MRSSGRCDWETCPEDTVDCVQSMQFIARLNTLLVEHVVDLQVLELAGLLGVLLEIVEVVAEVEGSDSFS